MATTKRKARLPETFQLVEGFARLDTGPATTMFTECARKLRDMVPPPPDRGVDAPVPLNKDASLCLFYPTKESERHSRDLDKALQKVADLIGQIAGSTQLVVPIGGAMPAPKKKKKGKGKGRK